MHRDWPSYIANPHVAIQKNCDPHDHATTSRARTRRREENPQHAVGELLQHG